MPASTLKKPAKKTLKTIPKTPSAKRSKVITEKPLMVSMIIDGSGSMDNLTQQTINSFNEYLQDRKRENPDSLMGLTVFNTERNIRYVAEPVANVPELNAQTYIPTGGTALNDAVCLTALEIEKTNKDKDYKVLVVVITDGEENSSTDYSTADVKALVERKEKDGWKFVFFGSNISAFAEGTQKRGIMQSRSVQYAATPGGTAQAFRNLSATSSMYACNANLSEGEWSKGLRGGSNDLNSVVGGGVGNAPDTLGQVIGIDGTNLTQKHRDSLKKYQHNNGWNKDLQSFPPKPSIPYVTPHIDITIPPNSAIIPNSSLRITHSTTSSSRISDVVNEAYKDNK